MKNVLGHVCVCNACLGNLAVCVGMLRCLPTLEKKLHFRVLPMVSEERVFATFKTFCWWDRFFSPSN